MEAKGILIENSFNIGEIVYLRHDIEQLPRMIVGININKYNILYELISGTVVSNHLDFEMSIEKVVY